MGPGDLEEVLSRLPIIKDPRIVSGGDLADDAGIFRLNEHTLIIQTVDLFPPVVDDPYDYGAIAAANSLSDIYAMGGIPLTVLNIAGFPSDLDKDIIADILRGGLDKVTEAGAVILGGHTLRDKEIKFGMAVTGILTGSSFTPNSSALPGDDLILTKPIGTGIIATGIKTGKTPVDLASIVVEIMKQLNKESSRLMMEFGAHAATDITGFGLLGHAFRMAKCSKATFEIQSDLVPVIEGTYDLLAMGIYPGNSSLNRFYIEDFTRWDRGVEEDTRKVLCDAQTSGGLLIAVDASKSGALLEALRASGAEYSQIIGRVLEKSEYALWIK